MTTGVRLEIDQRLAEAYGEHRLALLRFLRARLGSESEAEDVLQDVYLKLALAHLPEDLSSSLGYLYRIAANAALDHVRQRSRRERRDNAWVESVTVQIGGIAIADAPSAEQILQERQRLEQLNRAVENLPLQARRVFIRHKLEGVGHADIAAELGVSRSAVEKSIAVAMRHLLCAMDKLD